MRGVLEHPFFTGAAFPKSDRDTTTPRSSQSLASRSQATTPSSGPRFNSRVPSHRSSATSGSSSFPLNQTIQELKTRSSDSSIENRPFTNGRARKVSESPTDDCSVASAGSNTSRSSRVSFNSLRRRLRRPRNSQKA